MWLRDIATVLPSAVGSPQTRLSVQRVHRAEVGIRPRHMTGLAGLSRPKEHRHGRHPGLQDRDASRRRIEPRQRAPEEGRPPRARLFDADRTDERLELADALRRKPGSNQLLWIDADGPLETDVGAALGDRLKLDGATIRALTSLGNRPAIAVHGKHLHLRVLAEPGTGSDRAGWIDIVIAENLIITVHDGPADVLDRFDDRLKSDATVGRLTASSFLRSLLDAIVTTYFEEVDRIEDEVDRLDARALRPKPYEDILPDLVEVRRRIEPAPPTPERPSRGLCRPCGRGRL